MDAFIPILIARGISAQLATQVGYLTATRYLRILRKRAVAVETTLQTERESILT